ncbi:MAG TPA: transketolase [Rectinemataceae bacterium]|nr:transketolase [Rectinemataceae bacterium]
MDKASLDEKAARLRRDILKMLYLCQSGHPGGSLSSLEILMALYYGVARTDPRRPRMEDRDRIVLSKGHACPALYAVLADRGFFPREELWSLRQIGSRLQGHPDMNKTPGVDASTGSLGQGISIALGMAMAAKAKKAGYRVFCVIGDGEAQEGMVWEAAMAAAHYRLDNLAVLMDHNGLQIDGPNEKVMGLGDIEEKFRAFGFETSKVDGHHIGAIAGALRARAAGRPLFVLCETLKGKGVSFMEGNAGWHGKPMSADEYAAAMKELGGCADV